MPRSISIVFAAGLAGAVFASVMTRALSTPALASPSWSAAETKVGTVDVLLLLERMLETEAYLADRDASSKVWNDQIQPLAGERDGIVQTLSQMDPNDPNAQALYEQYQGLQQRIGSLTQEASRAIDTLSAQQLTQAYQAIHSAVQEVAEERGYGRVFSSRMSADDIDAQNTNVVVQEVLLRPVLWNVPADDLTDVLIEKLGLVAEEAPAEVEGPAVEPGG